MTTYILRRLLLIPPTLLGITIVAFFVMQLAPGNPVAAKLGIGSGETGSEAVSAKVIEEMSKYFGYDKPIYERYWIWLTRVLQGDFGRSTIDQRPALEKILERLPMTLQLSVLSIFLSYAIAVPLGVAQAVRRNTFFDHVSTLALFILYSLPTFWVALLFILYFGSGEFLTWFPIYDINSPGIRFPIWEETGSVGAWLAEFWRFFLDRLWHLVLPVVCLTYPALALLSRLMRTGMLDVIRQDYIRTAAAKGLPEKLVVFRHALRNSVIPIVTMLGSLLPSLIGGAVIVESIFSIPGMGKLGFESILFRDYFVLMGILTISAVLTLLGFLISDLLYVAVDPRIRFE